MSAPACAGCRHLLVAHGAGKCWMPGCDCPSTPELWDKSLNPEPTVSEDDARRIADGRALGFIQPDDPTSRDSSTTPGGTPNQRRSKAPVGEATA